MVFEFVSTGMFRILPHSATATVAIWCSQAVQNRPSTGAGARYCLACARLTQAAERIGMGVAARLFLLGFGLLGFGFGLGFLAGAASACLAHFQSFHVGP